MSESTTTEATTEPFNAVDFSAVKDGSRVANEDHDAFEAAIGDLFATTVEAATAEVSASDAVKRIADRLVGIRMLITTKNQIPDFGATSDAYRLKVNATFNRAFDTVAGIDEAGINRVKANARKAVGRSGGTGGPLLREAVKWVVTHENGFGQWLDKVNDAEALAKLTADPPPKIRKRVNELYEASKGLTPPYAPAKGDGFTAPEAGPTSAVTNLKRGAKAVAEGKVVPFDSSEQLLVIVRGMAVQFLTRTIADVENLPKVRENVDSAYAILTLLGPAYRGEASGDQIDKLTELVGLSDVEDEDEDAENGNGDDAETADVEAKKLAEAEAAGETAEATA